MSHFRLETGKEDLEAFPNREWCREFCTPRTVIETKQRESNVNRHSTVTHYQRPTVTQLQEGGTGGEVSEILFFSAKSKRPPSLIYSMQIIPVCLSIVTRRKGVSATRRGGLNWTPISLLVGHPCKLFHKARLGHPADLENCTRLTHPDAQARLILNSAVGV